MIVEPAEQPFLSPSHARPRHRGRAVLLGGVAAACVMGVGLGLWARPAMHERRASAVAPADAVAAPPAVARQLQIVVDDRPAPATGAPIPVLPASAAAEPAPARMLPSPAPAPMIEPRAPVRPPEGLIRANAVSPPAAAPQPLFPPGAMKSVVPAITGALAATGMAIARAEAPPAHLAAARHEPAAEPPPSKPAPRPVPHADRAQLAKAQAAKAQAAKVQIAAAQAAKTRAAKIQLARAEAAKAHAAKVELAQLARAKAEAAQVQASRAAAHRLELAQLARSKKAAAKAAKAEQLRLAQAEAKGREEAREEARQEALADARKRVRLASLAHAIARAAHRAPAPPPVELARLDTRHGHKAAHSPKVEQTSLKTRRGREAPRLAAAHPLHARPELLAPQPGNGLVRVSTTSRCANREPGEAAVCADPSLGAADRQMARAYQVARAAGVPDAQLRSQQQRWLAARSSAAREAPWAVRDVYMARIAELNGQAKDAQDGY
jgi:hypothetical protein